MYSPLQKEKEEKEWLDRKYKTLYKRKKYKIKNVEKIEDHTESNRMNSCPLPVILMSWRYFISHPSVSSAEHLLPGNGKGSQPYPCVPRTALSQHNSFRFTDDSGGAHGLSETALDRYWNCVEPRTSVGKFLATSGWCSFWSRKTPLLFCQTTHIS